VAGDPVLPADPDAAARDAASRRRARIWWVITGVAILGVSISVIGFGGGQGRSGPRAPEAFCRAADRYEKEAERQAIEPARTDEVRQRFVERQVARVEELVATAPRAIRADAETFLTELRRVEADPTEADDGVTPAVKGAVDNVNRFANQRCGVYDREGGL
jgi:hypothetical protein